MQAKVNRPNRKPRPNDRCHRRKQIPKRVFGKHSKPEIVSSPLLCLSSRKRVCETILRALTGKIERELNLQLLKARLDKPTVKVDPQKVFLTGLLNDRIGALRQEFIGHRRHRKTALVKEQVQSQRMKQQQLILKQQQTVAVKQEELSVNEIEPSTSPAAKKPRKSKAKEPKIKRSGSPEQKNTR